jgi:hypothetical protein
VPAEPTNTLIHFRDTPGDANACGAHPSVFAANEFSRSPGRVTCFACRKSLTFRVFQLERGGVDFNPVHWINQMWQAENQRKAYACGLRHGNGSSMQEDVDCVVCRRVIDAEAGGVEPPAPVKLSGVMQESPEMQALHRAGLAHIVKRGLNAGTNDAEHEALTELADALGLVYDDDSESYH